MVYWLATQEKVNGSRSDLRLGNRSQYLCNALFRRDLTERRVQDHISWDSVPGSHCLPGVGTGGALGYAHRNDLDPCVRELGADLIRESRIVHHDEAADLGNDLPHRPQVGERS